jgi:DNA-binding CsgD family transcriptional regulator
MTTTARTHPHDGPRLRVAIVASDAVARQSLCDALDDSPDVDVLAWADSVEPLLVLGTRADVCLCLVAPPADQAAQLRERGCAVVVDGVDPLSAVRAAAAVGFPGIRRPALSARQREVLEAYVSSSDLLPTVARRLGMDPETVKTHLRRIRAKYADVGRPAPTRRDLYVRAVEDGVLPPPSGRPWQQ